MDNFLDYMGAILGAIFLLITMLAIPEIRKNKRRLFIISLCILFSAGVGLYQIHQTHVKEEENKRNISEMSSNIKELRKNYAADTTRFSDFKQKLGKFHIVDSANTPVKTEVYNTTFKGNVDKVHIGPEH